MNNKHIAVIGLGYVGLPLLIELDKHYSCTGFDIDASKIQQLRDNHDITNEVNESDLKHCKANFSSSPDDIKEANIKIVTVPTPINAHNDPDLSSLEKASEMIAKQLKKGDIVVYESTVYPGVTEDICAPILEKHSGLSLNKDFYLGYSPERLSPGNSAHTLSKIVKVVSGSTDDCANTLCEIYGKVVQAGIHKASSIKVAEAAKVIENTQRDLNVALMNELAIIFNKMNINTLEVIEAAATKWNFMKMTPGLVGGHCIGVDPYYLTYKAEELGYHPQVILSGRKINDGMGKYVANETVKMMIKAHIPINRSKVGIFGLAFKENVSDIRNSKVVDIINELKDFGVMPVIHDPHANADEVKEEYDLELTNLADMTNLDAVIIAVAHDTFKALSVEELASRITSKDKVIYDIKNTLNVKESAKNIHIKTL